MTPIDVAVFKFCEIWLAGICEIMCYLPDKKYLPASQTVANARIMPKICQGRPPTTYSSAPDFMQIVSLLAAL